MMYLARVSILTAREVRPALRREDAGAQWDAAELLRCKQLSDRPQLHSTPNSIAPECTLVRLRPCNPPPPSSFRQIQKDCRAEAAHGLEGHASPFKLRCVPGNTCRRFRIGPLLMSEVPAAGVKSRLVHQVHRGQGTIQTDDLQCTQELRRTLMLPARGTLVWPYNLQHKMGGGGAGSQTRRRHVVPRATG